MSSGWAIFVNVSGWMGHGRCSSVPIFTATPLLPSFAQGGAGSA